MNRSETQTNRLIPYSCQTLDDADIEAVVSVLKSPYLTQGPTVGRFEASVAQYCGVDYAVAFSSGTAALHAACAVAGLGVGDELITSTLSFVASANAALYLGAKPRLADCDPDTWNMAVDHVETLLTPQTKILMPVHFAGAPVDLARVNALAEAHQLVVIEDASHALGAQYHGRPIGQCRDMAVFSFHPVKSLTTGEGGMVVTPHRHYYEALMAFRSHGIIRESTQFVDAAAGPWHYEMQSLGYNYRLTDIQAALGVSQLAKLDSFIEARHQIVERYDAVFKDHPWVSIQARPATDRSAHHLYPIVLKTASPFEDRRWLHETLKAQGILTQVHYRPIHMQPYYRQQGLSQLGDCPHAEAYYAGCLSIPVYPTLSESDQRWVIEQLLSALALLGDRTHQKS